MLYSLFVCLFVCLFLLLFCFVVFFIASKSGDKQDLTYIPKLSNCLTISATTLCTDLSGT